MRVRRCASRTSTGAEQRAGVNIFYGKGVADVVFCEPLEVFTLAGKDVLAAVTATTRLFPA